MTAKDIDATAADWAARIDRGLSPDEERALARWLETDTRNRGAFMRMRAVALHTERARALGTHFDPDKLVQSSGPADGESEGQRSSPSRRVGVLALAAAAACAAIAITLWSMAGADDYDTRQGEVRVVSLADGSVMTLNTASRAKVSFDDEVRQIRLIEGEALFDVARDETRPFVVAAGDASVRAVGTSFAVRRLADGPVQVIVQEGVVEVREPGLLAPIRVSANMRAELPARPQRTALEPVALQPEEVSRELAWREGRLAFEAETLAGAAAAFARYSQTRIVINDPDVARKEITGLFAANDPIAFANAAATSLGLEAEIRAGEVHLNNKNVHRSQP